jgi:amidase
MTLAKFCTASEMIKALKARKISTLELTKCAISQIERHDNELNAICVRAFEAALIAAAEADSLIASGDTRPLLGVPITVKESFDVVGLPTTWGDPEQRDFYPKQDALAVRRARKAGAIILGKTNISRGLRDWQSYNPLYGLTVNPYDSKRTPGGSSGGSAAALAAGYGGLSLGSDIAGSLRIPAHFCGVYAHNPSFALVPTRGHVPPGADPLPSTREFSVVGPMARSAADLTLTLEAIAGPDLLTEGVAYRLCFPPPRRGSLRLARIFIVDEHPLIGTSGDVRNAVEIVAERLQRAGAAVSRQSAALPDLADCARLYVRMLEALLAPSALLQSREGLVGNRNTDPTSLAEERILGSTISHSDWLLADRRRNKFRDEWRAFFRDFDALICPVMPTAAFEHDHVENQNERTIDIDGKCVPYLDQIVWSSIATLSGLPSTALPVTISSQGLPIGLQIVGPYLEDATTLKFAELIEREVGAFTPPPDFS